MLLILIINKGWKLVTKRSTHQKEIIESELKKFKTFFTADDLFKKVRLQNSKIGIATIYRFLKEKVSKDEINSYYCDRRQIYSLERNSHSHFICSICGKTMHVEIKDLDFLKNKVKGKVSHFQIDMFGICDSCLKKEN